MDNLPVAKPHMVTWEQDRQELREEAARMTMAQRLEAATDLNRRWYKVRGVFAHESSREVRVASFVRRKG